MAETQNESNIVYTGSGKPVSRRAFLKLGLGLGAAAALAGCAGKSTLSPIEAQATQQANTPEGQKIADLLPPAFLSGLAQVDITAQDQYAGVATHSVGTGQVYAETDTHLYILTAEHLGKGFFWKNINISFPYGDQLKQIRVDARIGAPNGPKPTDNDWWIENVTPESNDQKKIYHPIRVISIKKPVGSGRYVTRPEYGKLTPFQGEPKPEDVFYCGGFPADTGGGLVFTELKFKRVTTVPHLSGDLPLYEFKGLADDGMSGAAIVTHSGACLSILSSGFAESKTVWGIPFVQNLPKV